MNIFFLSRDPFECARFHHDKHVVKMILETTQILSTVNYRYGKSGPYSPTHEAHPSTLWAGDNVDHYSWLVRLGLALCGEYSYRYHKRHACEEIISQLIIPPKKLTKNGRWNDPPQVMPDEYKTEDTVQAYRNYYLGRKVDQSKWTGRPLPKFVKEIEMAKAKKIESITQEAPKEKEASAVASRGPKGVAEAAPITILVPTNPKRSGSKAHARFEAYRDGMSVKEALDAGVLTADLVYDSLHGFIKIEGYDVEVLEKKVKEPKQKKEKKEKIAPAQDELVAREEAA